MNQKSPNLSKPAVSLEPKGKPGVEADGKQAEEVLKLKEQHAEIERLREKIRSAEARLAQGEAPRAEVSIATVRAKVELLRKTVDDGRSRQAKALQARLYGDVLRFIADLSLVEMTSVDVKGIVRTVLTAEGLDFGDDPLNFR